MRSTRNQKGQYALGREFIAASALGSFLGPWFAHADVITNWYDSSNTLTIRAAGGTSVGEISMFTEDAGAVNRETVELLSMSPTATTNTGGKLTLRRLGSAAGNAQDTLILSAAYTGMGGHPCGGTVSLKSSGGVETFNLSSGGTLGLLGPATMTMREVDGSIALVLGTYGGGFVFVHDSSGAKTLSLDGTDGHVTAKIVEITGADLAEKFPVAEAAEIQPGMVVAIDAENPGQLCLSRRAYNHGVAGIVSGAGDLQAGTILGNLPGSEDAPPIALSGRVWCYADAGEHAILPGDPLTTSDTPGHAMKAVDRERLHGAVLGKAMTSLKQGERGLVLVLVNLH